MQKHASTTAAILSLLVTTNAAALGSRDHRAISVEECVGAGISNIFCERLAVDVVNVDADEWSDFAAHAVPADDADSCDGARQTSGRLHTLGNLVSAAVSYLGKFPNDPEAVEVLSLKLGRALHTIQDNCAHQGMRDAHHAWLGVRDTCVGTHENPDSQPEALECAREETRLVMDRLSALMRGHGLNAALLPWPITASPFVPAREEVCRYLNKMDDWDGVEDRWDNAFMRPVLRNQLLGALLDPPATSEDPCIDGNVPMASAERVDTSRGDGVMCLQMRAVCVGFDEDAPVVALEQPASLVASEGGCAASGPGPVGVLVGLGLLLRRRRA